MIPIMSGTVFSLIQSKMGTVLSQVKYPKFSLLFSSYVLVYVLLAGKIISIHSILVSAGFFTPLLAGLLYPFAATSVPASAMLFSIAGEQNTFLVGLIASIGAIISDLIIFHFIRHGFGDEVQKLLKEKAIQCMNQRIPKKAQEYVLISLAAILIASPLPTEVGVAMLASSKRISTKKFSLIVYPLHAAAIFTILLIGNII